MPTRSVRVAHADRVLEFMKYQHRPIAAYGILEALRDQGIATATTVCRALDKLLGAGRIHRIEPLNAWTACCDPHHAEFPVLEICDDREKVAEHVDDAFARGIAALTTRSGFAPERSVFEIHGRCGDCHTDGPTS